MSLALRVSEREREVIRSRIAIKPVSTIVSRKIVPCIRSVPVFKAIHISIQRDYAKNNEILLIIILSIVIANGHQPFTIFKHTNGTFGAKTVLSHNFPFK